MIDVSCLVVYQSPFAKKRYGNRKGDGGYVVCETGMPYDALLSCGIGRDISFDNDFLRGRVLPAYAFDHTIKQLPQNQYASKRMQWVKKSIGKENSDSETNLAEYIERYSDVFIKMDIEGGEYPFFESLAEDSLSRISQIVIEVHEVKFKGENMLKMLMKTHTIFHAHANNNKPTAFGDIPPLLELTFVRNTDVTRMAPNYTKMPNTQKFPHDCDVVNIPSKPDIDMNFHPFLSEF